MIKKYRKKPIVVEALQIHGNLSEIKSFVGNDCEAYINDTAWQVGKGIPHTIVIIHTLKRDMWATDGCYIIKDISGEFCLCEPDIFEKTYEVIEEVEE